MKIILGVIGGVLAMALFLFVFFSVCFAVFMMFKSTNVGYFFVGFVPALIMGGYLGWSLTKGGRL